MIQKSVNLPRNRRGEGNLEIFIWLAILASIVMALFQIVPVLYERYELGLALDGAVDMCKVEMSDAEIRVIVRDHLIGLRLDMNHSESDVDISRHYNEVYLTYIYSFELGIPGTSIYHPVDMEITR